MVITLGIAAGCSSKATQDTKAPQPQIGIIDVQKAIKAHPKYPDWQRLQQEYTALAAEAAKGAAPAAPATAPALPDALAGINDAASQEFNAKMAAKQDELKTQLQASYTEIRQQMSTEFDAYAQELDKTYQPEIFSLQLKMKTLQLSKDESAKLQSQIDGIQKERADKLSAKQQQLAGKLNETMSAKDADMQRQLNTYGQQLHAEIQSKVDGQQAELAKRMTPTPVPPAASDIDQKLEMKRQEMKATEEYIVNDIKDKTAKVAAQQGLEVALANVKVNATGVDITDAVIAEFNK